MFNKYDSLLNISQLYQPKMLNKNSNNLKIPDIYIFTKSEGIFTYDSVSVLIT